MRHSISVILCLFSHFLNVVVAAADKVFEGGPLSYTAQVGDRVELSCRLIETVSINSSIKDMVRWHRNNRNHLTMGLDTLTPRAGISVRQDYGQPRMFNLVIARVHSSDAGSYKCIYVNDEDGKKHTFQREVQLVVNSAAKLKAERMNKYIVKSEGGGVKLECDAEGSPTPRINWYRMSEQSAKKTQLQVTDLTLVSTEMMAKLIENGGLQPVGREISLNYKNASLTMMKTSSEHTGYYLCWVSNGIGEPVWHGTYLFVEFLGNLEAEQGSVEVTGGSSASLSCQLSTFPPAVDLTWMGPDDQIDARECDTVYSKYCTIVREPVADWPMDLHRALKDYKEMRHYSLRINQLARSDFGKYSCQLRNKLKSELMLKDARNTNNSWKPVIDSMSHVQIKSTFNIRGNKFFLLESKAEIFARIHFY
ncbi:Neural cell adhesion molecule L1 [Cichlidogyrus casuarinus]|uniref:Neural cell adhesion molecule L1 n=1 Tax=Cichlidogyrus casuarinus TaxID=1844966 RepID=A0ABD2QI74_9PLAT